LRSEALAALKTQIFVFEMEPYFMWLSNDRSDFSDLIVLINNFV